MFFPVSKILWALAVPSTALASLAFVGLLLSGRWPRLGRPLAAFGVVGLLAIGLLPLGRALALPLEQRFPVFVDDGRPVDGVVVLGGAELPDIAEARGQPAYNEAAERLLALGDLARRYPEARMVFAGGSGATFGGPLESNVVRATLPWLGLAPDRVLLEGRSRNTQENAQFAKELVGPRPGERWLLVTSAAHMPRAVGCFRAAGFEVVAYPVDHRTAGTAADWTLNRAVAVGLNEFDIAAREWIGLIVYSWTGRTSALFPAP